MLKPVQLESIIRRFIDSLNIATNSRIIFRIFQTNNSCIRGQ